MSGTADSLRRAVADVRAGRVYPAAELWDGVGDPGDRWFGMATGFGYDPAADPEENEQRRKRAVAGLVRALGEWMQPGFQYRVTLTDVDEPNPFSWPPGAAPRLYKARVDAERVRSVELAKEQSGR